VARQRFELAMAHQLPGLVKQQDSHLLSLPLPVMPPQEEQLEQDSSQCLAQAKPGTPPAILPVLREKRPVPARRVALQEKDSEFVSAPAKQRLVLVLVTWVRQRDLFLDLAKLQEQQRQPAKGSPVPQGRARRCLRCPGPSAFSQETLSARKCNRAARCDDFPIFVRYRPPRNRRALAGCDNKCSRSQRRRVPRARTFLIAVADKCRCLLRRTAD
jgi:hypothetical protein